MDAAYGNHRLHPRRNNHSLQYMNSLSLAPLTLKWPLSDPESIMELDQHSIYISDRSAPTTPSVFPLSPSYISTLKIPRTDIPKSKSSSHLLTSKTSSAVIKSGRGKYKDETRTRSLSHQDRNDSDWLLRAGAVMISSARESKGQDWLVSRASSTSVRRLAEDSHQEWDRAYYRESAHQSKLPSARESSFGDYESEFSSPKRSMSMSISPTSRVENYPLSRRASRVNQGRESKAQSISSPKTMESDSYFEWKNFSHENQFLQGPDFLDTEYAYEEEEVKNQDEAIIRNFSRAYSQGIGGWIEKFLNRRLFALDDDLDESDTDDEFEEASKTDLSKPSLQALDVNTYSVDIDVPPPQDGDVSGWQDAVWFLSVAMKALF